MVTKRQYIEYLLNTPINYTCSNLAEHLDGVSHSLSSQSQAILLTATAQMETAKVSSCRIALSVCQYSKRSKIFAKVVSSAAMAFALEFHGARVQLIPPAFAVERVCATASPPARYTGSEC